jgi:two-component system chemotaxis response regulator CheY
MRIILRKTLADLGCQVFEAAGGPQALELLGLHGSSVDFMLVDWNMPEMTGLELIQAIRRQPELSKVAVIMVTTETGMDEMSKALAEGANEYLMKPFTKEMLADKLRLMQLVN